MRAVAMATPEMTVKGWLLREVATIPANPPKKAMMTSKMVGRVRASNSDCASLNGEIRKYKVDVIRLIITMMMKLRSDFFSKCSSKMPTERPMPMIGPMMGEINMAPMMTAVELTFSPTEATMMAKASTHRFMPRNSTPSEMYLTVAS